MKVLLTGSTSGIGFSVLQNLVAKGTSVIALGRDFGKIDDFIKDNSRLVQPLVYDFSDIQNIESLFNNFNLSEQKLDGLIHCAGIEETIPLRLYDPEKIKRIFEINVYAGIELLRNFSKKKNSNDGSSVVFLSSVMGNLGQPGKVGYCATKAAVLGVVKSAAIELSKRGIRVNAILPGVVETPMTQKLFEQLDDDNINRIKNMHPLGLGSTLDIASMISFLMTKEARWITGQNITIDGGYSIQ